MVNKPNISSKNNKNEILDAYNKLLAEVQNLNDAKREQKQERQKAVEIVSNASEVNKQDVIRKIADLKITLTDTFDDISTKIIAQRDRLAELQTAITLEEQKLENIHEIKANADSLEALILAQNRAKEEFETDMLQKKQNFEKEQIEQKLLWDKEKSDYEAMRKEQEQMAKKERERKLAEYEYEFKLQQQKDQDIYEMKKAALERELTEYKRGVELELNARDLALKTQENELVELRKAKEVFDEEMKQKLADAVQNTTTSIEMQNQYEKNLLAKETEGQISLLKQTIATLEDKLKEKQNLINELAKQTQTAQLQAQELAKKVIESNSTKIAASADNKIDSK